MFVTPGAVLKRLHILTELEMDSVDWGLLGYCNYCYCCGDGLHTSVECLILRLKDC